METALPTLKLQYYASALGRRGRMRAGWKKGGSKVHIRIVAE